MTGASENLVEMEDSMTDRTLELARRELRKYGLDAELRREPGLPSFEIRREKGRTVIAGPDSVELLYGVYDLAERFCGWFFFEPGRDRFDRSRVAVLPEDGVVAPARKPLLAIRGLVQEFPFDKDAFDLFDWMAKNKLNHLGTWTKYYDGLSGELKEEAAVRGIAVSGGGHNFSYWIPAEKYAKTHPEFFAEIGGRRIRPSDGKSDLLLSEQLCTTNPELRAEMVKNIIAYCDEHPEVKSIPLTPNDGFGWCECPRCSGFYDKSKKGDFYSLSEHVYKADRIYHDLVRDVAARLRAVRPDLSVGFGAYINYCSPSPGMTLEKGMDVGVAVYWRCINHAIDDPDCPINSRYAEDIRRWAAVKRGGRISIYEYYMGVNFYLMLPMIHFREMFREIRWYADNRIDGLTTQFHVSHWSVYGMNYNLMARAARGEEENSCISLLFERLFCADAEEAKEFYRKVKQLVMNTGHCHIPYPRALLRRSKTEDYQELYRRAQALAAKAPGDPLRADLVLWTEYMIRFKRLFDDYQAKKLTEAGVRQFLDWIHTRKANRVLVTAKIDMYFRALLDDLRTGREWIHFNLDWEDAYIRRHDAFLGQPRVS